MEYVFIISERGDRTNIKANFKVLDLEMVISSIKKETYGQFRYAKVGEECSLLSSMPLGEFDTLFKDVGLSVSQIAKHFSKEVREKYGDLKIKNSLKRISKKDLVIGQEYKTDVDDYSKQIYLGKCHVKKTYAKSSRWRVREDEEFTEICYLEYGYENKDNFEEILLSYYIEGNGYSYQTGTKENHNKTRLNSYYIKHTKSLRKFIGKGEIKMDIPKHVLVKDSAGNSIEITFLEIN